MIEVNGKQYRNLQEQVLKNQEDIALLKSKVPYPDEFYTKEECDEKFQPLEYIHNVTLSFETSINVWYVNLKIKNDSDTPFTSPDEVLESLYDNYGSSNRLPASGYEIATDGEVAVANPILYVRASSQTQIEITRFSISNIETEIDVISKETFTEVMDQVL